MGKDGEGERAIVKGHHDAHVLQTQLDGFTAKYVCCEACDLPEVAIAVKKGVVLGRCRACGWRGPLGNNHKLASFISKNPPDETGLNIATQDASGGKEGKKSGKQPKAVKAKEAQNGSNDNNHESHKNSEKEKNHEKGPRE